MAHRSNDMLCAISCLLEQALLGRPSRDGILTSLAVLDAELPKLGVMVRTAFETIGDETELANTVLDLLAEIEANPQ